MKLEDGRMYYDPDIDHLTHDQLKLELSLIHI